MTIKQHEFGTEYKWEVIEWEKMLFLFRGEKGVLINETSIARKN